MSISNQLARFRDYSGRALVICFNCFFVIMWLTVVDVILRYNNISITGLFEVIEVLMGILVFAGVPIITAKDGHVAVTILVLLVVEDFV